MNPNVYIVSEEMPCPLRGHERHIGDQRYFRNAEIAYDFYTNKLEDMTMNEGYVYVLGKPLLKELKDRFMVCGGRQECQLYSKIQGSVYINIKRTEICTSPAA